MLIIGCDFHTRFQQIAMLDTTTAAISEVLRARAKKQQWGLDFMPEAGIQTAGAIFGQKILFGPSPWQ